MPNVSKEIPTHNPHKDVAEYEGANEQPENNVQPADGLVQFGNFPGVSEQGVPVVQGEEDEECDEGVGDISVKKDYLQQIKQQIHY